MNSLTYQILRVVGSPFVTAYKKPNNLDFTDLYTYATKNRMLLLYLNSINKPGRLDSYQRNYHRLLTRYAEAESGVSEASDMLESLGVSYAFFKSIRPYEEVTVDFDILVFGLDYNEVCRAFHNAGYLSLARGPLSTTFRDMKAGIDFDVYNEIGVSHIIYLDKDKLINFISKKYLSNGRAVPSLDPKADLLAVIGHSVIKEQMYVLSEYYTTLYHLFGMKKDALNSFLSLANNCRMSSAIKTHLGITALLHQKAHGTLPESLNTLLKDIDTPQFELSRISEMNYKMPYKYHPLTIAKALFEKFREKKASKSFVLQALRMSNPRFTSSVFKKSFSHILRESY